MGRKQPNAFGLYDMLGNVWEWCQDWHGDYPQGEQVDPQGASSGQHRVSRGGSWGHTATHVRSASRGSLTPDGRLNNLGLRVVAVARTQ